MHFGIHILVRIPKDVEVPGLAFNLCVDYMKWALARLAGKWKSWWRAGLYAKLSQTRLVCQRQMCPIDLSGHKNSQGNANGTGELVMVILENYNGSICIIVSKFNKYISCFQNHKKGL